MTDISQEQTFEPVGNVFMLRVFYCFAAVAFLTAAISLTGRYYGDRLALGGHSARTTVHEIVIGNNVVTVPENMIRYPRQRHGGVQPRLDLYMSWPQMSGYRESLRDIFNHVGGDQSLIFLSFEEQIMSRDMTGRFEPIYSKLIKRPAKQGPAELAIYQFREKSGYVGEMLVTGAKADGTLFVARCAQGDTLVTSCERDILIGEMLTITYRFPASRLAEWRAIDAAVASAARKMIETL